MNTWLVAAAVLSAGLAACGAGCLLYDVIDALVALELAGVLVTAILMLLAEGTHRQAFIDLAVVFAVLDFAGSLTFARLLERHE
jgi:multicomponent Na+:H+ antiporter subunit F